MIPHLNLLLSSVVFKLVKILMVVLYSNKNIVLFLGMILNLIVNDYL